MVAAYRSHTTATAGSGGYTIARPSGVIAGDVLVLAQFTDSGTNTDLTVPSGWTSAVAANSGQTFTRGRVFVKTATGSESATYSLAHAGNSSVAILICVSGASLPDVYASASAGTGNNVSTPTVTPSSSSGIELRFAGADGDGTARTFTPPATYTEPTGADLNQGNFTHAEAAYKVLASAAATGAQNHLASGAIVSRLGFTVFLPSAGGTDATATPSVVSATSSVPAPSVQVDAGATATPSVVTASVNIPAPSVSDGSAPASPPVLRGAVTAVADRTTPLTASKPTGVVAGDLLIAHHSADVGTLDDMGAPTGGAAWSVLDSYTAGENALQVVIYWKIAGGSEPTSWDFSQDASADGTVIIAAYSGASTSTPTVQETPGSGTSISTPGITPPAANSVELRFATGVPTAPGSVLWTAPVGLSEQADLQSTTYVTSTLATRTLSSSTPTGTANFTPSASLVFAAGHTIGIGGAVSSSQDATATPSVVSATTSVPAPSAGAGSTASPSVVTASASIPAPATSAGSTASPSTVTATTSVPSATVSTGSTATATVVQATASVPAPTARTGSTASPTTVQATASVPAAPVLAQVVASPSVVSASTTVPAPTAGAGATAAPSVVQATSSVPAPTVGAVTAATPSAVTATSSVGTPSVSASSTAATDVVEATASVPAPTLTAGATADTGVVSATTTIPAASTSTGSTASPDTVTAVADVPSASVSAGATITAASVEASATIPAPTVATGQVATPAVVSASATVPAPDVETGATASPAVAVATSNVPAPDVTAEATATPATVQATTTVPAPGVSGGTVPASELRDDFAGASLDTDRWTATNSVGVVGEQAGGVYRFDVDAAAVAYSQLASAGQYDLTGSTFVAELVDAGSGAAGLEVYFTAEADASNRLTMVVAGGFLGIYKTVAGVQTGITFPAYSPTDHRWLRIREDAGTTYWEASPDGSTWAELHSEATPITVTSTRLILQAGAWQALGADTTVVFDNVGGILVSDATASPETVPATTMIPAPTASAGATAAPGVVAASATVPEPDVSAGTTASAPVVAAEASVGTPEVSASSTASPEAVGASAAIPGPTAATGATAHPDTVQAGASIGQPDVEAGGNATATPTTVNAAAAIPGPSTGTSTTATPTVVLATAAVPTPTTTVLVAATPAAVQAYATIPAALLSTAGQPPAVAAVASIPTPAVSTGVSPDLPPKLGGSLVATYGLGGSRVQGQGLGGSKVRTGQLGGSPA
ncbi:beta strand repeat-containing protein [Nonomuraea bangladeshensis]|uniref:beta strand repeat-containing protein n=1 Tax=Nonomuraea bangladeshensis TaxID=404385 RepID=UPI003C2B5265